MDSRRFVKWVLWCVAAGVGTAAASYATYVGITWFRYGHAAYEVGGDDRDALLDAFIPTYEVAERHHVQISAPTEITFAAAKDQDLLQSVVVRAIFRTRELVLRATPDDRLRPRALLAQVQSLGWGVLAEVPGREIVMGAVTQPWKADVVFRALSPEEFATFHEPGYVKIVWTLRADPIGTGESLFRTETRVVTTDPVARAKFRRYWSFVSPGIVLIRFMSLRPLKREAERRAREAGARL